MLGSLAASNNMRTISTEPLLEASWRAEPPCQRSPVTAAWRKIVTKMELKKKTKTYTDVSKNRGTPKWMVCNGKPY